MGRRMRISRRTLDVLTGYVTGDNGRAPYRSGPKLVSLFNSPLTKSFLIIHATHPGPV